MFSREEIQRLCERIAERGDFVEAGWASFRLLVVAPGFDETEVDQMRIAFFSGALWMFSDLIEALQRDGYRPQEPLIGHIEQVNRELGAYVHDIDCANGIRP